MEEGNEIWGKGKLNPRFIGPYEVIEKVGPVAYRLALPPELEKIHNVFYVSMLRRYRSDPSHVVSSKMIELRPDLMYEEEPVKILARSSEKVVEKANSISKSAVEKPQDRGSHVGKRRSYLEIIPSTVQ